MDDTIRHAIASWGFLLPRNSRMTLAEFAALIRAYSDHPRAQILAAEIEGATGIVARKWNQFGGQWQSVRPD